MARKTNSITTYLSPAEAALLREQLLEHGYRVSGEGGFSAVGQDVTAQYYSTGSLLVQGKAIEDFLDQFLKEIVCGRYAEPVVGTDEAGKGDYFGPLVVAAVWADRWAAETLLEAGVQDSKRLSDDAIRRIAPEIIAACPHSVISIGPERYNDLHSRMHNVNLILAWAHARALENVLEKRESSRAITDKFANSSVVEKALMEKGRKVHLTQITKAERELPVAAASILARSEFVKGLEALEKTYGMHFPKGATIVEDAGRTFVKEFGEESLQKVAKWHFKTTKKILGGRQLEL